MTTRQPPINHGHGPGIESPGARWDRDARPLHGGVLGRVLWLGIYGGIIGAGAATAWLIVGFVAGQ
jgi:hypothetical protein